MSSAILPPLEVETDAQSPAGLVPELAMAFIALVVLMIPSLVPGSRVVLLLAAVAAAAAWITCRRVGWLARGSRIRTLCLRGDGTWLVTDRDGNILRARLRGDSRVYPGLVWLRWDTDAGRRQVLLLRSPDPGDSVRRLIVRLRLSRSVKEVPDDVKA